MPKICIQTLLNYLLNFLQLFVHSPYDVMKVDSNFGYAEDHLEFDPATMEIVTGTGFDE